MLMTMLLLVMTVPVDPNISIIGLEEFTVRPKFRLKPPPLNRMI